MACRSTRSLEGLCSATPSVRPSLTAEQVLQHARTNLTGYKRPHHVEFRDELPKTNVGKILRRELRD